MVQAGQPVSVGERVSEGDAFTVYRASAGDAPLAVSWYPDLPGTRSLAKLLTWLVDIGSPHPAFTWPIDTVMSEEMPGFGLIMPLPEPGLESLGQLLSRAESPSFPVLISIARQLVSAFEGLHEAAMCYRDIGLGTILVDADQGAVALVDIDAIAPDHSERYFGSTSPFMAPEVVRGEAPVSWRSDRHSLAVLLFFLFMHGHPLDGSTTDPDAGDESEVALRAFGLEPVFVFDPENDVNRPARASRSCSGGRSTRASSARCSSGPSPRGCRTRHRAGSPRNSGSPPWRGWRTASGPVRAAHRSSATPTIPRGRAGTAG